MKAGCRETASFFVPVCLHVSEKTITFASVMNWKFIIKWVSVFAVATVVWTVTARYGFWMSLGVMILLAVLTAFVTDWIEKRRNKDDE